MADDEIGIEDAFDKRDHEFVDGQGIRDDNYTELLELADAHAQAASVFPNAPAWRQVGPRNLAARIIALEQDPTDPRIVYAGSAFGGLWRSIDAGDTWERLGDASHVFPVGAIGVPPAAPRVIYFGTGAVFPLDVSGRGLFRATIQAGREPFIERLAAPDDPTVAPPKASPGAALRYTRIRVDPDEPTRFWAASQTGLWRCECPLEQPAAPRFTRDLPNAKNQPAKAEISPSVGPHGTWLSHCTDLLVAHDPRETATVTRHDVEVPRYLILFVAVESTGIFRGRFDRREETVEFESSPLNLPTGALNFTRVKLAQCEGKPEHVFAVFAEPNVPTALATEVYHSSNSGNSWTKGKMRMSDVGAKAKQADFNLVLEVAPDDPAIVVLGANELCISGDFGSTWTQILNEDKSRAGDGAQHEDQHVGMFDRANHRRLWVGNDGGLALATDLRLPPQASGYWRTRSNGIVGTQAQDVSINPSMPFMTGIGLRDNGTWLSFGGPSWYQIGAGDGGALAFNLPNPRQIAVTFQTAIVRSDLVAFDQVPVPPATSDGDIVSRAGDLPLNLAAGHRLRYRVQLLERGIVAPAPFYGVIEQHPTVAGHLLTGRVSDSSAVGDAYGSVDFGANWSTVMAAPLGSDVTAVAFGPADARNPVPGNVDGWAGLDTGLLFFTNDAPAGTWAAVATPLPFPGALGLRISEIVAHPRDRRIVAVSATGIQGRVFITFNQGRTWTDVTEPTPTSLVIAPLASTVQVGKRVQFTATATYAAGGVGVDVTARVTWTAAPAQIVSIETASQQPELLTGFGREGSALGVVTGAVTVTATLVARAPVGVGRQSTRLTVTNAVTDNAPIVAHPRPIIPGSLPPGPLSSVIFDPAAALGKATTLLAGTLPGVYALPSVPVVTQLDLQPPGGALTFQIGAGNFQLRCDATFSDTTVVDATADVDWSVQPPGIIGISNVAPVGEISVLALGNATISAHRAGVTVSRDVHVVAGPATPPSAFDEAPKATDPSVPIAWSRYSNGLPQVLITDFERVGTTNAIRASTFGLGVFEVVTTGAPEQQLYIRQTVVEDGRTYPRPAVPPLPDDPRLLPGVLALDYTHAFDIRVDAPPFSFFDDVVDGAEFDQELEIADAIPTEINYVYVQVHNAGTNTVPAVSVHLYAARCAATDVINPLGALPTASPASLEAGAPIADLYNPPNFDPLITSNWQRVDTVRVVGDVLSGTPQVARFSWVPDAALGGTNVALLAVCTGHPLSGDTLPATPAGATLAAFIVAERRAALRIVRVGPRPAAALYIRDGVADDTRVGGYVPGGRSPDIMVVHPDITDTPDNAFKDHIARRASDTISHSATNVIYVRVHNRRRFQTLGRVKVFAIPLDDSNEPSQNTANWTELPPAAAFADVTVPASGFAYVRVELPAANDPNPTGTNKTYLLLAMIRSGDDTDPLPNRDRLDSADTFWGIVSKFSDSDNAAARAVPWVP